MSAAELLAKLSTGSTQRLTVPGGAIPELTQSDIAAALTGTEKSAELLVRIKYAGDTDYKTRRNLEILTLIAAADLANHYDWNLERGKNRLEPLAILAIDLVINPPLCRRCHGRGDIISTRGVVRICPACNGFRLGKMTDTDKSKRVGVHRNKWPKIWEPRLKLLICELRSWEVQALDVVYDLTRGNNMWY